MIINIFKFPWRHESHVPLFFLKMLTDTVEQIFVIDSTNSTLLWDNLFYFNNLHYFKHRESHTVEIILLRWKLVTISYFYTLSTVVDVKTRDFLSQTLSWTYQSFFCFSFSLLPNLGKKRERSYCPILSVNFGFNIMLVWNLLKNSPDTCMLFDFLFFH